MTAGHSSGNLTRDAVFRWPIVGTALACWITALILWRWVPARRPDPTVFAQLNAIGRAYFQPDYDIPIYLVVGSISVVLSTFAAVQCLFHSREISPMIPVPTAMRPRWLDLIVPLAIIGIVWTPDPATLAGQVYAHDLFHHVNFYVMAPLQAYRHGAALGTSIYSQYGGGWVLVLHLLGQAVPLDYALLFSVLTIFGAGYFITVYAVLRSVLRDAPWAMAGVLACVWLQLFCGTDAPKWGFPSSTVARCPWDLLTTLALLQLGRTRRIGWAAVAGSLGGLSLLFGVDTGIYVLAGLCVAAALLLADYFPRRDSQPIWALAAMSLAWVATVVLEMWIASRGTSFQSAFWPGYFEVLTLYPAGFSSLPIAKVLGDPIVVALLLAVVMTYTLTLAGTFARALCRRPEPEDLACAFLAVVGFGTLILFINRSHAYNLFHPLAPACVLGTVLLKRAGSAFPLLHDKLPARVRQLGPVLISAVIIVALLLNKNFWEYPSAIVTWTRPHPDHAEFRAQFAEKLRQIERVGQEIESELNGSPSVLLGADPTLWLVTLDRPVTGRYCPPIPITKAQEQRILDGIPADRVVLEHDRTLVASTYLQFLLQRNYRLVSTNEAYSVWQRNSESPPAR